MDRTGPLGLHYEISSFETWLASVAATVLSATMGVCLVVPGQTTHGCSLFEEIWGHTKNLQILRFLGRWLEINNPRDRYICTDACEVLGSQHLTLEVWMNAAWGYIYILYSSSIPTAGFWLSGRGIWPTSKSPFLEMFSNPDTEHLLGMEVLGQDKTSFRKWVGQTIPNRDKFSLSQSLTFWRPHLTLHCHSFVPRPVSLDSVTRLNETLLVSAAAPLVVRTCGLVPQLRCLKIGTHQVPWFDNLWSFSTFKLHKLAILECIPHPWTNPLKCLGHCHLAASLGPGGHWHFRWPSGCRGS